ncbi:MAG: carboxymuconolactone decarboxylase family protein [Chloroflexi bacterium]|nr:carboxymuconolactone decarboxylase family protein [Chloroflexota bacterium]
MARLPYVDRFNAEPAVQEVFRKLERNGARIVNIYRMVGHTPAGMLPFMKLGNALMTKAQLDGKLREIVILRVAVLSGCQYEWTQHAAIAREVGVTEEQIAAVADWESSGAFDEREKTVLKFADEVFRGDDVTDETFARAGSFLNAREIVELTLSAVFWRAVAGVLLTLRVDVEEGGGLFGKTRSPRP